MSTVIIMLRFFNLNLCERLTMTLTTTVVGLSLVLEDTDLAFLTLFKNLTGYLGASYVGLTDLYVISGYEKNFVECYFCAFFNVQFSMEITLPSSTTYCFPPVLIIAYICAPPLYYTRRCRQHFCISESLIRAVASWHLCTMT